MAGDVNDARRREEGGGDEGQVVGKRCLSVSLGREGSEKGGRKIGEKKVRRKEDESGK